MNQPKHRGNPKCIKTGQHEWRQQVWGTVGTDVCVRRGCDATRTNPMAVPPWAHEDDSPMEMEQKAGQ